MKKNSKANNNEKKYINKVILCKAKIYGPKDKTNDINKVCKKEGICIVLNNENLQYTIFIPLDIIAGFTYDDIIAKIAKFYNDPNKVPEIPLVISKNASYTDVHVVHDYDETTADKKDKLTFQSLLEAIKYAKWREKNKNKPVYYVVSASGEYYCSTTTQINGEHVYLQINDWHTARNDLILCRGTDLNASPNIVDINEDPAMYKRKPNIIKNSGTEYSVKTYCTSPLTTVLHAQMLNRKLKLKTRKRK